METAACTAGFSRGAPRHTERILQTRERGMYTALYTEPHGRRSHAVPDLPSDLPSGEVLTPAFDPQRHTVDFAFVDKCTKKKSYTDANFPCDEFGATYHLGTKKGEVANRILSVGSDARARLLAEYLEPPAPGRSLFMLQSGRGFLTITGRYNGVPVSIVTTMMGTPNMDFVVRENRAVVEGDMAIVRLGTCGAIQPPAALGVTTVAFPGSVFIRRDPDAFTLGLEKTYAFSLPVPADPVLSHRLRRELERSLGKDAVAEGLNATADSFYSSQGRVSLFDDRNHTLLGDLVAKYPNLLTLEMETFHLLDLARCSNGTMVAAAAAIALADRRSNDFLQAERIEELERAAGQACLTALAAHHLVDEWDLTERGVKPVWVA